MSGFVGTARYRSSAWDALLPWLVFGQGIQAGKYAVKGHGVYEVALPLPYWRTAQLEPFEKSDAKGFLTP